MYIVVDEKRRPLCFHDNPYGCGQCLCDDLPQSFTLFSTRYKANRALKITRKYAKGELGCGVDRYWKTDSWVIIKAKTL